MTIARDHTGAVVGQLTTPHYTDLSRYGAAWTKPLRLLTRDGRYVTVPASSVRLEEVR